MARRPLGGRAWLAAARRYEHSARARGHGGVPPGGVGPSRDGEVAVSVDGKKVVEAHRVKWNFLGNRMAVLGDGVVVEVMWDVYDWWFAGVLQQRRGAVHGQGARGRGWRPGVDGRGDG
ncbi:uncharacterized protein C2845_PM07G21900 [Panicum miliaceum]|uniref:Uncharacterized protein n=1 Tax=Panicum miliaceum TaxID=4540 RepID=A0A3L6SGQ6_PANMI|nr:uncharacterized protein C2845_PM07G21900 [Panicum miliaceum]